MQVQTRALAVAALAVAGCCVLLEKDKVVEAVSAPVRAYSEAKEQAETNNAADAAISVMNDQIPALGGRITEMKAENVQATGDTRLPISGYFGTEIAGRATCTLPAGSLIVTGHFGVENANPAPQGESSEQTARNPAITAGGLPSGTYRFICGLHQDGRRYGMLCLLVDQPAMAQMMLVYSKDGNPVAYYPK